MAFRVYVRPADAQVRPRRDLSRIEYDVLAELATELDLMAVEYRELAGEIDRACATSLAGLRERALRLARTLDSERARSCLAAYARTYELAQGVAIDLSIAVNHGLDDYRGLALDRDRCQDLAVVLQDEAAALRADHQYRLPVTRERWVETRVLDCLARLLPGAERSRFVAEALGNLGACEPRLQRIDQIVCLMFGTPRLAWMLHRENRRGRARWTSYGC